APVAGKLVRRGLTRILTPGTALEDSQLDSRRGNYLAAISWDKHGWHASWLDVSTADFRLATDVSPARLLPLLHSVSPREVILPEGLEPPAEHREALEVFLQGRATSRLPGWNFDGSAGARLVAQTLSVHGLAGFGLTDEHPALGAAGAVLGYVTDSLCDRPKNLFRLIETKLGSSVLLDAASSRNLELFASSNGSREGSLLETIDRTETPSGARLLALWLAEPSTDLATIARRQDAVGEFFKHPGASSRVGEALRGVRDIARILARLQNRLRNPRELGGVRDTLRSLPPIREELLALPGGALAEQAGRIVMLEDRDGDGVFDRSTVFADGLTVPKGACWLAGSLYVASPPGIWKFTDTNGDGVADQRKLLVGGFQWTANGADVHGPWAHPDGRLYWTHGRKGHDVRQTDGSLVHKGLASGVWSMRPDGSDVRWHSLICGDNPTGLAIAPTGEIFGTCNLYNGVPRHDTIGQWQLGGIYTRPDFLHIVADQLRTHLRMPLVANLGHMVPSGCALWSRGPALAPDLAASADNLHLLVALYNSKKVIRLELQKEGAGYRASEHDFLTLTKTGAHLTDVVEAPDGSLLVLDTGTWYPHCPSSLLNSANVTGSIYRVRPVKPVALAPAQPAAYRALTDDEIVRDLGSADAAAARRACEQLSFRQVRTPAAIAALRALLDRPLDPFLEHAALYAGLSTRVFAVADLRSAASPRLQARLLRILAQVAPAADRPAVLDFAAGALDTADAELAENVFLALTQAADGDARVAPALAAWLTAGEPSAARLRALERFGVAFAGQPRTAAVLGDMLSHAQAPVRQVALRAIAASTGKLADQPWRPALSRLLRAEPGPLVFAALSRVKHKSFDADLA
ncbi:hypothetical protein EBR16_04405, partial [bacterium]|nr:hypothetical protein [bacterium]